MSEDIHHDLHRGQRTSLYLVRRAEALLGVIKFFSADQDATRRRLQFLAQSDFWDWEIDNLIYSFTNLAERQETWRSPRSAVAKLAQLGLAIDAKLIRKVAWHGARGGWRVTETARRVAPLELLGEVVDAWNGLIDRVEQQFVAPMREKADKWNLQTRRDLRALRKQMPAVGPIDEASHEEEDQ